MKTCGISLQDFDNSQVLEKKKDATKIDVEFNVIMEKMTEFVGETPSQYDNERGVLKKVYKIRDDLRAVKENYQSELEKQVRDQD